MTVFISVIPVLMISVMHFFAVKSCGKSGYFYLTSIAIGGLLGDVFFHTFPHIGLGAPSGDHHHHDHSHSEPGHHHHDIDLVKTTPVLLGIFGFFIIETLVNIMSGGGHDHSHVEDEPQPNPKDKGGKKGNKKDKAQDVAPK